MESVVTIQYELLVGDSKAVEILKHTDMYISVAWLLIIMCWSTLRTSVYDLVLHNGVC